jgi:hypothetical protein
MLRGSVSTSIQTAVRGAFAARTQKKNFGQTAMGVANVGLSVAGAPVPGFGGLSNALGSALGSVFGEIDEGVAEAEQQLRSSPVLAQQVQLLADTAALRRQLRTIKTKLESQR